MWWRSKVSHWAKPREERRQKEGGGGGREHLFVIMVQIQTCWWVWGVPCISWRYPRWPVPPSSISSLLALPAHRAQTAALARRWCPGQKRNFLEVNVNVLKSEQLLHWAGKPTPYSSLILYWNTKKLPPNRSSEWLSRRMNNCYAKFMQIWLKFRLHVKCYSIKLQGLNVVISQSVLFFCCCSIPI